MKSHETSLHLPCAIQLTLLHGSLRPVRVELRRRNKPCHRQARLRLLQLYLSLQSRILRDLALLVICPRLSPIKFLSLAYELWPLMDLAEPLFLPHRQFQPKFRTLLIRKRHLLPCGVRIKILRSLRLFGLTL